MAELSVGQFDLSLALPIDADCRLEIRVPSDMPLTSDLAKVDTKGVITGT